MEKLRISELSVGKEGIWGKFPETPIWLWSGRGCIRYMFYFGCWCTFFDIENWFEYQKRNQSPRKQETFGFVFGNQLGPRQIAALITTHHIIIIIIITVLFCSFLAGLFLLHLLVFFFFLVLTSTYVCQSPSLTPNTKSNTPCLRAVWFRIWCSTRFSMSKTVAHLNA